MGGPDVVCSRQKDVRRAISTSSSDKASPDRNLCPLWATCGAFGNGYVSSKCISRLDCIGASSQKEKGMFELKLIPIHQNRVRNPRGIQKKPSESFDCRIWSSTTCKCFESTERSSESTTPPFRNC